MDLQQLAQAIPDLSTWSHAEKIKLLGWHLHIVRNQERFNQCDIRSCYDVLHLEKPKDVSPYFAQLNKRKPKHLLKDRRGYYLPKPVRDVFDGRYGQRATAVQVDKSLSDVATRINHAGEKVFLDEALACFKCGAFRAAIVMCWNLCFNHLCAYVWDKHLLEFNTQLPRSYPNGSIKSVNKKEDFEELKEFQILQVCRSAGITTSGIHKVLVQKLETRNSAAHPSNVTFSQLQAEEFILTLVNNVVLKLA